VKEVKTMEVTDVILRPDKVSSVEAAYSAKLIAKWFLAWAASEEAGDDLSNLKLQKLLYYAQGHHLGNLGVPLFREDLQAWSHGPVVPVVYREYRDAGSNPLALSETDSFEWTDVDENATDFLIEVWDRYGGLAPWRLRDMTHSEPPWQETWKQTEWAGVISLELLRSYFATKTVTP
jgi:uncharacterized phage-associated protein